MVNIVPAQDYQNVIRQNVYVLSGALNVASSAILKVALSVATSNCPICRIKEVKIFFTE